MLKPNALHSCSVFTCHTMETCSIPQVYAVSPWRRAPLPQVYARQHVELFSRVRFVALFQPSPFPPVPLCVFNSFHVQCSLSFDIESGGAHLKQSQHRAIWSSREGARVFPLEKGFLLHGGMWNGQQIEGLTRNRLFARFGCNIIRSIDVVILSLSLPLLRGLTLK